MNYHYSTYDDCEDVGDGYECWNDDWDNDGEADDYHWTTSRTRTASTPRTTCSGTASPDGCNPFIDAGNHTMELTIEDLEVGTNYTWRFPPASART